MKRLLLVTAWVLLAVGPVEARFVGDFELVDNVGGDPDKPRKLKNNFAYEDPTGTGWEASAGLQTDGASIPAWAQPIIGGPFDTSYIKAAVLHDHYCDRTVRDWRLTHRMFYDALIELGVPKAKAKVMYYAVYIGGPKWKSLVPGKSCKLTDACIKSVGLEPILVSKREPIYTEIPGFSAELQELEKLLEINPEIDLDDLERRADLKRPDDPYLTSPGVQTIELGLPER